MLFIPSTVFSNSLEFHEKVTRTKMKQALLVTFSFLLTTLVEANTVTTFSSLNVEQESESDTFAGHSSENEISSSSPKLLIILIDGFRWDYYFRQKAQLPGFTRFLNEGVYASWVDPIFPSLSFPSWTTITTGLYPEEHNILGNFMLWRRPPFAQSSEANENVGQNDATLDADAIFHLKDNSTKAPFWWESAEPLWTTVTKAGKRVFLANWARCDVPFHGISPEDCTGYVYQDVNYRFRQDLQTAVKRLKDGFSLAMVYDDFIDHTGHMFGPDSQELRLAMAQRDSSIQELLMTLRLQGMRDKVNVIITSDHGMTNLNDSVKRVSLAEHVDESEIHRIVDYGPTAGIFMAGNETKRTAELAERLNQIEGISAYPKAQIPEELHYKNGKFVPDLLLVAHPGYYINGVKSEKQVPQESSITYKGVHGYYNMTDMRTIFFAKGPAFQRNQAVPPIRLVDQYQIFLHLLQAQSPHPHHGNWEVMKGMLKW